MDRPDSVEPPLKIEESDLYQLDGDWLYVQNPERGLNVIDVSNADAPRRTAQLPELTGEAGELYVRDDDVFVLFKRAQPSCQLPEEAGSWLIDTTCEVTAVRSPTTSPELGGRQCLPGEIVASRLVGDILYVVTAHTAYGDSQTWLFSIDVSDPDLLSLLDTVTFDGQGHEVHVTQSAIYVVQDLTLDGCGSANCTAVTYVDISDPTGAMTLRDSVTVPGSPMGRFHMDATDGMFRIVTNSGFTAGSNLCVIDATNPDLLTLRGQLTRIAPGEDLHGTRFVGDKAYIVTYEPIILQTDPLWVVSLEDPARPEILGHLEVPGWSDYVFPRDDLLVAVGRGDRGLRVAASLFDVADPTRPRELRRLEFGAPDADSEANTDFRGVSIIQDESLGLVPLITVPYTNNLWTSPGCEPQHYLQLIELQSDDLLLRDNVGQIGRVRRALAVQNRLYAVTDKTVASMDVTDRNAVETRATVTVGDPSQSEQCTWDDFSWNGSAVGEDEEWRWHEGCSVHVASQPHRDQLGWLIGSVLGLILWRRRRAHRA